MGARMRRQPRIFHVNWFRLDEKGKFLWPGYTENLRVLEWIIRRCNNKVGARDSAIGYLPYPGDLDLTGLPLCEGALEKLLEVRPQDWQDELRDIKKFFAQFKKALPEELWSEYKALEARLK
jgi:phosphoenolpyruvate carboxykinase (GTP)